jgi:hypothetical protein
MGHTKNPEAFPLAWTTTTLGIINRVNETLGKITSHATNFIT